MVYLQSADLAKYEKRYQFEMILKETSQSESIQSVGMFVTQLVFPVWLAS